MGFDPRWLPVLEASGPVRVGPSVRAPVPPPAGCSEDVFQSHMIALAEREGWHCYHTHDSRRSAEGFPDLVLVRGSALVFAELKVGKNGLTPEQREWLKLLAAVPGAIVRLWRPCDWNAIVAELEGGGRR